MKKKERNAFQPESGIRMKMREYQLKLGIE